MSLKGGGVATAQIKASPPPYAAASGKPISSQETRAGGAPPPLPSAHPPLPQVREPELSSSELLELDGLEADSIPPLPVASPEMRDVPIPSAWPSPVPSDPPELPEQTQVSPTRARAMRVIVGVVLAACLALMFFAGRRYLQRRYVKAAAPELTAGVVATPFTSQPSPAASAPTAPPTASEAPLAAKPPTEAADPAAQAAVPSAAHPAPLTKTRSSAPAVRRSPSRPVKTHASPRKPVRSAAQ